MIFVIVFFILAITNNKSLAILAVKIKCRAVDNEAFW